MQVNAIINATGAGGKKISTTISYLRESQESKAAILAQTLNALTTNTYQSVQVNEINVTDFQPIITKIIPNVVIGEFTTYDGTTKKADITANIPLSELTATGGSQGPYIDTQRGTIRGTNGATLKITTPETEEHYSYYTEAKIPN